MGRQNRGGGIGKEQKWLGGVWLANEDGFRRSCLISEGWTHLPRSAAILCQVSVIRGSPRHALRRPPLPDGRGSGRGALVSQRVAGCWRGA